jgi:transposase InsO family protein
VNANKDDIVEGRKLGVELICRVLQVAPSTYYAARGRVPSVRALNDAVILPQLCDLWKNNFQVYGVRKFWKAARRAGIDIGRDQTARLMGRLGMRGVLRSKRVKTTTADPRATRHPDLVTRVFAAEAPHQLWVTDVTFVATWAGVAYVCFIIDVFSRMIVGWRVASHMRTETVLDAIEMARWSRGQQLPGLRSQSDAGAVYTSADFRALVAGLGMRSSVGRTGVWDNSMAESFFSMPKKERVYRTVYSTEAHARKDIIRYIEGFYNSRRRHSALGYRRPNEVHYGYQQPALAA